METIEKIAKKIKPEIAGLMKNIVVCYAGDEKMPEIGTPVIIDIIEDGLKGCFPGQECSAMSLGWFFNTIEHNRGMDYSVTLIDKDLNMYLQCYYEETNGRVQIHYNVFGDKQKLEYESLEDLAYCIEPRAGNVGIYLSMANN